MRLKVQFRDRLHRFRASVDSRGMNTTSPTPEKNPICYNPFINFETGETEWLAESSEVRRKRLAAERAERKAAAFSNRRLVAEARNDALTLAWQRIYAGGELPVHYDLILMSGEFTKLERYTLLKAHFTLNVFDPTQLVGSKGAIKLKRGRRMEIEPAFTHSVRLA